MRFTIFIILLITGLLVSAQGFISYDYFSSSRMRETPGSRLGSGGMYLVSGSYNIPLVVKMHDESRPTSWAINISAVFAEMSNKGESATLNPGSIINSGLSIIHLRPLSEKWDILASLGGGVFAPADEISAKSILGSGGVIFIYRMNDNLSLGAGGGITNSYGPPMAVPMLYLSWQKKGKFSCRIDMTTGIKISASTRLWKQLHLEFTPMEVDGLTAVMKVDGKNKIYSMAMLQSYLSPEYRFTDKFTLFARFGGNWIRGVSINNRSLKGFFDSFKDDDKEDPYFQAALRLSTGIKFKF